MSSTTKALVEASLSGRNSDHDVTNTISRTKRTAIDANFGLSIQVLAVYDTGPLVRVIIIAFISGRRISEKCLWGVLA
jgi:hypothetical protein